MLQLKQQKNSQVGVIGTEGTIKSDAYTNALSLLNHQVAVKSLACPKFAPLVESSEYKGSVAKKSGGSIVTPV